MIPKTIHYVWMGRGEKNAHIKRCMKTWERRLKGYEIIEWNEDNFDIESHPFVKKAYERKQWAFVSDYVRFYAVYHYGGVYFDTDVVVAKDIDRLLNNEAFVGFETPEYPFTAVFGCEKHHMFAKKVLDYYDGLDVDNLQFVFSENNTLAVSKILINDFACEIGDKEQTLQCGIKVFPSGVLCAPSMRSVTIHAFTSTWTDTVNHKGKLRKIRMFFLTRCTNKFSIAFYLLGTKIYYFFRNKKMKNWE